MRTLFQKTIEAIQTYSIIICHNCFITLAGAVHPVEGKHRQKDAWRDVSILYRPHVIHDPTVKVFMGRTR